MPRQQPRTAGGATSQNTTHNSLPKAPPQNTPNTKLDEGRQSPTAIDCLAVGPKAPTPRKPEDPGEKEAMNSDPPQPRQWPDPKSSDSSSSSRNPTSHRHRCHEEEPHHTETTGEAIFLAGYRLARWFLPPSPTGSCFSSRGSLYVARFGLEDKVLTVADLLAFGSHLFSITEGLRLVTTHE
ncbi:hypothetical protein STAS_30237 [Striga asiatica]|uniref:Uncharacterized protein n=1 Tax=Striga asiatica TaxID=4170 RepID=A0A5A7R5R7_STRAF|nr:hypothetical protein STAS_30237 [Striga asiatica]